MSENELVELSEEEYDTLDVIIDKVWRTMNRELETDARAVPIATFIRAAEKAGHKGRAIKRRLYDREDFHHAQYMAGDRRTPVHAWFKGVNPPDEYVPRLPKKVRLTADGALREIEPDKRYRFQKRQWWGFQLIKAADAGELA